MLIGPLMLLMVGPALQLVFLRKSDEESAPHEPESGETR
jgi:hypothetical protein